MTTRQIAYEKLWLTANPEENGWWEGTRRGVVTVPLCNTCGQKFYPIAPACPKCQSMDLGWFETSGKGVIHTYFVPYMPTIAAFASMIPYVGVVVELPDTRNADGTVAMLPGMLIEEEGTPGIGIGAKVTVEFEPTAQEEFVIPRWKLDGVTDDIWQFEA